MKTHHLVTIQKPVETQDGYGSPNIRWQTLEANVWASIEPVRGREFFAAKQVTAEIYATIRMRWRQDVTAKMKIVHGPLCVCKNTATEEYLIESIINPRSCNRSLELMCTRFIE